MDLKTFLLLQLEDNGDVLTEEARHTLQGITDELDDEPSLDAFLNRVDVTTASGELLSAPAIETLGQIVDELLSQEGREAVELGALDIGRLGSFDPSTITDEWLAGLARWCHFAESWADAALLEALRDALTGAR